MDAMYDPKVGETVWLQLSFIDGNYDEILCGVVQNFEIVDEKNGYKMYGVECDDTMFNVFSTALYQHRSDALRQSLTWKMDQLTQLQREITRLEAELGASQSEEDVK
jgi:hypothetical protein